MAYAAKEGTVAADGEGRNSPYTEALLRFLEEPGLDLGLMFRKVRDAVLASTGRAQEPFVYGSLSGEGVFLKPPAGAGDPAGDPSRTFLPSGMSLSDWALLAEDDLKGRRACPGAGRGGRAHPRARPARAAGRYSRAGRLGTGGARRGGP